MSLDDAVHQTHVKGMQLKLLINSTCALPAATCLNVFCKRREERASGCLLFWWNKFVKLILFSCKERKCNKWIKKVWEALRKLFSCTVVKLETGLFMFTFEKFTCWDTKKYFFLLSPKHLWWHWKDKVGLDLISLIFSTNLTPIRLLSLCVWHRLLLKATLCNVYVTFTPH